MFYFAYGSNMNLDHMRRLCGWHFEVLGPAVLDGHEFGGDTRGFANIRPQAGKKVCGVLYKADQACIDILDDFEGYPDVFGRSEVQVTDALGKKFTAWVYTEPETRFVQVAVLREDYIRRVLAGAIENHLPEEWVKFLETFLPKPK